MDSQYIIAQIVKALNRTLRRSGSGRISRSRSIPTNLIIVEGSYDEKSVARLALRDLVLQLDQHLR